MADPVLEVTGLTRSFSQGGQTIEVLRGVDLQVGAGEIVALLGPSGSGKSTMLQAVGLLEGGFGGTIRIAGEQAARLDADGRTRVRRDTLGFIYQFHHLLPDFTASENVELPMLIRDATRPQAAERAGALLTALGLGHRLTHRPSQLSGGEQQRVAVARALANRPALVLADEPTGNLDEATADVVLAEFLRLVRGEGSAALVATHNERLAAKMDRVVRLHEGEVGVRLVLFLVLAVLSGAAHAAPRCTVPTGWSRVVGSQAHFVVFGETHGTTESPTVFGETACALAARHQRLLVAVELSENAGLQRAWSGPHARFATTLATEMPEWTTRNDGVTSQAMLAMLTRLHALKEAGAAIDVVAFNDTRDLVATRYKDLPGQGPHEAGQAENIRAADALHPHDRVLILVGNYHARKKPIMRRGASYDPMAMRLADPMTIVSLYLATGAGESWFCAMTGTPPAGGPVTSDMVQCGAHRVSADVDWSGPARIVAAREAASPGNPDGAYDATFFIGPVTASPPAIAR